MGLIPSFRKGRKQGRPGQALVEFALTFLAFLVLLLMIIEVGRIMFAWIVIQRAANEGARYAVTGQFMADYSVDPNAGWDAGSSDPYQHILPCWGLFSDDGWVSTPWKPTTPQTYQPFRNARTCSVENTVIGTIGPLLQLNPQAQSGQNNFYRIEVMSPTVITGSSEFERYWIDPGSLGYPTSLDRDLAVGQRNGNDYPELTTYYANINGGLNFIPGYAGDPQQSVVVRVTYNLPIISPVLSSIVPNLRLVGTAQLTNEAFGATGVQREAILPPPLPPVSTVGEPLPPDLEITAIDFAGGGAVFGEELDQFQIDFTVENTLESHSLVAANLQVWMIPIGSDPSALDLAEMSKGAMAWPVGSAQMNIVGGASTVPALAGFGTFSGSTTVEVPLGVAIGEHKVYMWVDSTAAGSYVYGAVDENGVPGSAGENIAREENNTLATLHTLTIAQTADLAPGLNPSTTGLSEGEEVDYEVRVVNNGPNDADDAIVEFVYDPGYTLVTSPLPAECSAGPGPTTIRCVAGDIVVSTSYSTTIRLRVNAGQTGNTLTNTAQTFSTSIDGNPSNDNTSSAITIDGVDIGVTKSIEGNPPSVSLGQTVTFLLTAENFSTNPATSISITDVLASGQFNFVDFPDTPANAAYDAGSRTVTWTIASLAPGASETIRVRATAAASGTLSNTIAIASLTEVDTEPANDTFTFFTTASQSDLQLTKSVTPTSQPVGSSVEFTFSLTNLTGPFAAPATGVTINNLLPASMSVDTTACTPTVTGGGVTSGGIAGNVWTLTGNIPVGTTVTLTFCARIDSGTPGSTITNTAAAASTSPDPVTGNNGASEPATITILAPGHLTLTQSVVTTSIFASQSKAHSLTIENDGGSTVSGIEVQISNSGPGATITVIGSEPSGTTLASGVWSIPSLNAGQSLTLDYNVNAFDGDFYTNQATTTTATVIAPTGMSATVADNFTIMPMILPVRFGTTNNNCDESTITWGGGSGANYHQLFGVDFTWPEVDNPIAPTLAAAFPTLGVSTLGNPSYTDGDYDYWTGGYDDGSVLGIVTNMFEALEDDDTNPDDDDLAKCGTRSGGFAGGRFTNLPPGTYRAWVLAADPQDPTSDQNIRQNFVYRNGTSSAFTNLIGVNFHFGDMVDGSGSGENRCDGSTTWSACTRVMVVVRNNNVVVTGGATSFQIGADQTGGDNGIVNAVALMWLRP